MYHFAKYKITYWTILVIMYVATIYMITEI